jgi:hypothetical protein
MDVNFQINTPTLSGGQYFKVWYRETPSGAFIPWANQDNDPFTITGLAVGTYELKVVIVLGDSTECDATFWPFTVVDPVECIDFNVEIIQASNGLYFLEVSYVPTYNPACGWKIIHANGTTTYPTLPASPILIPTQNVGQQVQIISDGCYGNQKECYNEDVPSITPVCTPMVISGSALTFNNTYPNGSYGFSLQINFTQSIPASNFITFIANQINVLSGTPGGFSFPAFSYSLPTSAGSFSNSFIVNQNVANSLVEVNWLVVDGCGVTHTGYASYLL